MLDIIINYSFYLLFFLTPLVWIPLNYELFEYNKMILTYGVTVVVVGCWLLKIIQKKTLILKRSPLDIPLIFFLAANILSTIFSIDPHTSFWGYYSRSNGGLLSIISYLLLYWAFVSNFESKNIKTLLQVSFVSGIVVSVWGILEHFGVSPSCLILRKEFNDACWIQDVQARVFATLGQPNWMAAYLSMLIFPALYFLLTNTNKRSLYTYYFILTTYYLAFTFTYSRGPTLGLMAGLTTFIVFYLISNYKTIWRKNSLTHPLPLVLITFLGINILFGSALTSFRLVSKFAAPSRPAIAIPTSVGTQLENGGTESGQIRLIVWRGALDIWKAYPILGSGLETFAYSYYQYRPVTHNLTSEWDFLYNKAHNEYLNYLATTGTLGILSYLGIIGAFIFWCIKYQLFSKGKGLKTQHPILITSLFASYISFLIYNFFLFSVVIIAIFFYLFPALSFVSSESLKEIKKTPRLLQAVFNHSTISQIFKFLIIFFMMYLLYTVFSLWYADTVFNKGEKASDSGNPGRAYNFLTQAVQINEGEPFYHSELAYSAAAAAAALQDTDATLSAELKDEALEELKTTFRISPKNVSFWRTAIRTYFELSTLDKKYLDKTILAIDQAIKLAPTDPKLYYNKALILGSMGQKSEEIELFRKVLNLKPNYLEVKKDLEEATTSAGQ